MPEYYTRELELSIKVFCRITLARACEGNCSTYYASSAVPKALWKWGVYFNIFPIFLPISESGGVTKSWPIDPFFMWYIYFLMQGLDKKSVQIYRFWVPSSTFCMYHLILFAVDSSFFTSFP